MRDSNAVEADPEEVTYTRAIEFRLGLGPEQGLQHPKLASLTLNQLVTVVERVGIVAATSAEEDRPTDDDRIRYGLSNPEHSGGVAAVAPQTRAALKVLGEWPAGYHRLLVSLLDRNPNPTQRNALRRRFATSMGLLAITPLRDHDGQSIEPFTSELKRFCLEHLDYTWGQRKHSNPAREDVVKRLQEIRSRSGAEPEQTAANVDLDPLTPVSRLYMSIDEAMLSLEGDAHASVVPWFQAKILVRRPGRIFIIERKRVAEIKKHLSDIAVHQKPCESLIQFHQAVQGRPNTKAELLRDIFAGRLAVYRVGPAVLLASLYLDKGDLAIRPACFRLSKLIEAQAYAPLFKINRDLEMIWGPMASMGPIEARQWVARGSLRQIRGTPITGPKDHWSAFYHVGDLIQITQSMFRPTHFHFDTEATALQDSQENCQRQLS